MRKGDSTRRSTRLRPLLRRVGRVALVCMVFLSAVANAYCEVDRGPLPVKHHADKAGIALGGAAGPQAPALDDDSCNASDDLSSMADSHMRDPGDAAMLAVQVLAFRVRSPGPEHAPSLSFFNQPPLAWEPVFQRVPRLLI